MSTRQCTAERLLLLTLVGSGLIACEESSAPPFDPSTLVPSAVVLTRPLDSLSIGDTLQLAAAVVDEAGNQFPCEDCAWASSDSSVATVSGSGLVRALEPGRTVITAILGEFAAEDTLSVVRPDTTPPPPAGAIEIFPGEDVPARVDSAAPGTAFTLKAGIHRLTRAIIPKDGMSFTGEAGAVLSGARLLTEFEREGRFWVATGQTQEGPRIPDERPNGLPRCEPEWPRCTYPEDLFINDVKLRHIASLGAVGPGAWYFDYPADKIYFVDDPTGRTVEASATAQAFRGSASSVTIRGLIVEKFATPLQLGVVSADSGTGWHIEYNEVRHNHAIGIMTGTGTLARRNYAHHNGEQGMGGVGDGAVIEDNEIAFNNVPQTMAYRWTAGGTKWSYTRDLVLRGNYVHDNKGPGLWADIDNVNTLMEYNRAEDNARNGIFFEIGYGAVIRHNTASRNGFEEPVETRGGGIAVTSSPDVEIYGNTLVDNHAGFAIHQDDRGSGAFGLYELRNLHVHDNTVTLAPGSYTGLAVTVSDPSYYTGKNNRFEGNTYHLRGNARPFWWQFQARTPSEWQAFGQDTTGTFVP